MSERGKWDLRLEESIPRRMLAMLRRLEWVRLEMDDACPVCGALKDPERPSRKGPGYGEHYPNCDLAALLRELP